VNRKLLLFLFLALSIGIVSHAQINEKFWIQGKVIDSAGVVKDVNVINLKTNKGTFTNDFGDYKIVVSIGDTVQFTSVNHRTVRRVVNNLIYTSEVLDVFMPVKTEELDEFDLKRHDLDGYLTLDRKKTPVDRRGEAFKNTMDFSKEDMRIRYDGDFIDQNVRPPVEVVDPTALFVGAGAQAVIPFKYSQRLWALRKNVEFRSSFPQMLISEFGEKFFENDLEIPKERYYHFLEYCNPLGIEDLYKQNRKIEMINILREQSKSYLKLLEEEVQED
jgi:hypothetical protein